MRRAILVIALLLAGITCLKVHADDLLLLGVSNSRTPASGPATCTQTDSNNALSAGSSITWSGANIGTANANRQVILIWAAGTTIATGVTIGGVSATKDVEESSEISALQIWHAALSSGTTANIAVTASGSMSSPLAVAASVVTTTPTPAHTGSNANNSSPNSITITVPSNGCGLGAVNTNNDAHTTITWTNVTLDVSIASGAIQTLSTAHSTTTGNVVFQAQNFNSATQNHMVAATWSP